MRVVVLISGSGSNLQALIDACENGDVAANIVGVISNKPEAKGLARAEKHGISSTIVDHKEYDSRESFDTALSQAIDQWKPDLVVLAGFMRILTPEFVSRYLGRMINIHPSLLPKYPGLHTHRRALEAGDSEHGVTVHYVTAELDGGPAIMQAKVPVQANDSEETLAARVLTQEHQIYPLSVQWIAEGRVTFQEGKSLLDGHALPSGGYTFSA